MPAIADIIVKKADGTTNITFTALNPSSGDTVPAYWRSETAGAAAGLRPNLSLRSQWNGNRDARRVEAVFVYPFTVTDSTTSITTVKAKIPLNITMTVPTEVPDTVVAEAVAQGFNLFVSTLIQATMKAGFAPT